MRAASPRNPAPPRPSPSSWPKPRLFISGEWVEARSARPLRWSIRRRAARSAVGRCQRRRRRSRGGRRACGLREGPWRDMLAGGGARRCCGSCRISSRSTATELAELESLNNGKTKFMASVVDVPGTRDYFRYMAGWATKIEGATFETSIHGPPGAKFQTYTTREPIGVVAQIVPWNFPLAMAAWKLGPGAGRRLHLRSEARRADADDGAAPRRAHRRGRLSAGRGEYSHRQWARPPAPRWSRIRASTRSPSPARPRWARSSTSPRRIP